MTRHPTNHSATVSSAPATEQSNRSMWSMSPTVGEAAWEGNGNAPNFLGRDEAAAAITELADQQPGEFLRVAIARAARLAGFKFWRASDIHYGKARRIEQFESDAIAAALDRKRREVGAQ
jgi:hypothetical protein